MVEDSMVAIFGYQNNKLQGSGTGFVVFRENGGSYVLTNARVARTAEMIQVLSSFDILTTSAIAEGAPAEHIPGLIAEVIQVEPSFDYALLKVSGLDQPALRFANRFPAAGDTVWSVAKQATTGAMMAVQKGNVRSSYNLQSNDIALLSHNARIRDSGEGSLLVNECSQVVGLNMSFDSVDPTAIDPASLSATIRAVSGESLVRILKARNLDVQLAKEPCLSEVAVAKIEDEQAAIVARQAKAEAEGLSEKLAQRDEQSKSLVRETRKVGQTAEQALLKAEEAEAESRKVLEEFEKQAMTLREDTKKLVVQMEQGRSISEAEFKRALIQQQEDAYRRELLLILILGVLILTVFVALFVIRKRNPPAPVRDASQARLDATPEETVLQKPQFAEYVLDGRDENGIRYLLRISGDQMLKEDGIVIGRNPQDSPHIINHADVSRKHARMKVMKNRVFIEDLGSTNGTSINGRSIDDRGLVSVDNGDQIIIGSVVMKLRVLGA